MDKKLVAYIILTLVLTAGIAVYRLTNQVVRPAVAPTQTTATQLQSSPTPVPLYPTVAQTPDRGRTLLELNDTVLEVEVVNTAASITQGLSGRSEIGADGMLFVFSQPMMPRFWMKEMQFPLDLIWINQGKIVDITENVPAPEPGTKLDDLPTYAPAAPVDWVLEVPAGIAAQYELQVGDPVTSTVADDANL